MKREARRTVCNADATGCVEEHYMQRQGADARLPINETRFRQAERIFKQRNVIPTSIPSLVNIANLESLPIEIQSRIYFKEISGSSESSLFRLNWRQSFRMYSFKDFEGFHLIPNIFTAEEQAMIIMDTFTVDMDRPNISNLDAVYQLPYEKLWEQYELYPDISLKLERRKDEVTMGIYQDSLEKEENERLKANFFLKPMEIFKKIRWVTLGYNYDWTRKEYDFLKGPNPFPSKLASICKEIALRFLGVDNYNPEAGIINYYQQKDSLTGHVDKSEKNMTAPLISLSFGSSCVFLIGGKSREDPVMPLLLNSGDICILSGPARYYFHGVPRIIESSSPSWMVKADGLFEEARLQDRWNRFVPLIRDSRININVRQVF